MTFLLCEQFSDVETLALKTCFVLLCIIEGLLVIRVLPVRLRETARPFDGLNIKSLVISQDGIWMSGIARTFEDRETLNHLATPLGPPFTIALSLASKWAFKDFL